MGLMLQHGERAQSPLRRGGYAADLMDKVSHQCQVFLIVGLAVVGGVSAVQTETETLDGKLLIALQTSLAADVVKARKETGEGQLARQLQAKRFEHAVEHSGGLATRLAGCDMPQFVVGVMRQ